MARTKIAKQQLASDFILVAENNATSGSSSGADSEIGGVSQSVVVPSGKKVFLMLSGTIQHSTTGNVIVKLWRGSVGGTVLKIGYHNIASSGGLGLFCMSKVDDPGAGTYTYTASVGGAGGNIRTATPSSDISTQLQIFLV